MNRIRTTFAGILVALALLTGAASAQTIVGVASSNPDFSTLVKAVEAAGLVDTLNGPGPFTVFAPTDAAFAKLPAGQLDALLANKQELVKVLTYHVVPGELTAADVMNVQSLTTVEGEPITVTSGMDGVMVGNATVTATDIKASNGIIHVIDTVILPPSLTAEGAGATSSSN